MGNWAAAIISVKSRAALALPLCAPIAKPQPKQTQMTRPRVDQGGSKAAASGKAALVLKKGKLSF